MLPLALRKLEEAMISAFLNSAVNTELLETVQVPSRECVAVIDTPGVDCKLED
jgi:hypothetical protein